MSWDEWWRRFLTDRDGEPDSGRVLTPLIIAAMTAMEAYSVYNGAPFQARDFGVGVASVIGALGVYIWGDSHGRAYGDHEGDPNCQGKGEPR